MTTTTSAAPLLSRAGRVGTVLGILLLSGTLAACGGGDSGDAAPAKVATGVAAQLPQLGVTADDGSVTCPADAKVEEGSTIDCSFVSEGQPVGAQLAVTSVEDGQADVTLTTEARPVPAAALATSVSGDVAEQTGATITSATCAADLQPEPGQSVTCDLADASAKLTVRVTVISVEGGQVSYGIEKA